MVHHLPLAFRTPWLDTLLTKIKDKEADKEESLARNGGEEHTLCLSGAASPTQGTQKQGQKAGRKASVAKLNSRVYVQFGEAAEIEAPLQG